MARVCDLCGKHASVGHKVSHANNATLRKWMPNLRHVRALVNGQVKRVTICAKCLKAGKVMKAPHKARVKPAVETAMPAVLENASVAA